MDSAQRLRATYAFQPADRLYRREFYIWPEALERWKGEGMDPEADLTELFQFDQPGSVPVSWEVGWCDPPFFPPFKEEVVRTEGEHEIIRDASGRLVRVFKGRRHGFMPTYLQHAVADMRDWEEDISPRLSIDTPGRWDWVEEACRTAAEQRAKGVMLTQHIIGGYMFLRALMGPTEVLTAFYLQPELIRALMDGWFRLADTALTKVQAHITLDEIFLAEDTCYRNGLLISPELFREFLMPYFQQLLSNARARQSEHIYLGVDTDGRVDQAIDLYRESGMEVMTPFEVAAGCDVIEIAKKYPDLVMVGGFDKRILAEGPEAIDAELERIIPFMKARGGYIPTCDHGVPDNVSYANYLHYRRRMCEMDH